MALSVVVITKNEEANIERCLSSVEWADELVIIDSQSTDKTVEIATRFGARIF
ncbi:MAG: glycosyltransferase, partial [candidate division Zixibacteria bacterium]|nr:glycosyltransferase [candidate division Zixibacteria bacterium]